MKQEKTVPEHSIDRKTHIVGPGNKKERVRRDRRKSFKSAEDHDDGAHSKHLGIQD
jgi:hypothetical protein